MVLKKTKEQLERDVDELNERLEARRRRDDELLKEFARILGLGNVDDEDNCFIQRSGRTKLTYPVIFAEIGKLKAIKDFRDFEWRLSDIKDRLDNMTKEEGK